MGIAPSRGECTLLNRPKGDDYASHDTYRYSGTLTLRLADGSEVPLPTREFKRKQS